MSEFMFSVPTWDMALVQPRVLPVLMWDRIGLAHPQEGSVEWSAAWYESRKTGDATYRMTVLGAGYWPYPGDRPVGQVQYTTALPVANLVASGHWCRAEGDLVLVGCTMFPPDIEPWEVTAAVGEGPPLA